MRRVISDVSFAYLLGKFFQECGASGQRLSMRIEVLCPRAVDVPVQVIFGLVAQSDGPPEQDDLNL